MTKSTFFLSLFVILASSATLLADVKLPDVLADSMVIQQKMRIPVWGDADPGEAVNVEFAGQKLTATADGNGKWRVYFKPLNADFKPRTMTITGKNTIILKDILVGDVWLLSGQSNMQWTLFQSLNGATEVEKANHPNIRLFNVTREVGFKKRKGKLGEWKNCDPTSVKDFSGAGYYFGVELQRELKIPIGLINSSWGGTQAEAWTPVEYLKNHPDLKITVERTKIWEEERPRVRAEYEAAIKKWREESEKQKAAGARPSPSPGVPDALRDHRIAASIYDGMIEPMIPFGIKGAVWYQGESNETRAEQYGILLPIMIRAWRDRLGSGAFPFGIIQLPNFRSPKPEPTDDAWSHLRETQRLTAINTPNTGLIVTIDIGEANDIHPTNKLDVGKRMAVWALRDVYRRKIPNSPTLKSWDIRGEKMLLTFDQPESPLRIRSGDKLAEFAIAGSDQKWVWAQAKIVGKNKIEVWADGVKSPKAVRYAFNINPRNPNLTNSSGLPASPFRTDSWPDPTTGKR